MSASRCDSVLRCTSPSGVEQPAPRWSYRTMRNACGSKKRRCSAEQPPPGPPCRNSTGMPRGLPLTSQYMVWMSSSASMPVSYGSMAGYSSVRGSRRRSMRTIMPGQCRACGRCHLQTATRTTHGSASDECLSFGDRRPGAGRRRKRTLADADSIQVSTRSARTSPPCGWHISDGATLRAPCRNAEIDTCLDVCHPNPRRPG